MSDKPDTSTKESTPILGVLLRMYWFIIAYAGAALLTVKTIMLHRQRSLIFNGALLLIFVSLLLARFIDIKFFNGETAECRKATMNDFRIWSIQIVAVFGVLFALVHLSVIVIK